MKNRLILLCIATTLSNSACLEKCADIEGHGINENELAWFSKEFTDTTYFNDKARLRHYYLAVSSVTQTDESEYRLDYQCKEGGYTILYELLECRFESNIPYENNSLLDVVIETKTRSSPVSLVDIDFNQEGQESGFTYYYKFDSGNEEFIDPYLSKLYLLNQTEINGHQYSNVFVLYPGELNGVPIKSFYDTIYYNREGFLKFVSSQHGIVLERVGK